MTKLETLNRKMLARWRAGTIEDAEYETYKALLEAVDTLKAIRARVIGEFDCPELMAMGPLLTDTRSDVEHACDVALGKLNEPSR